MTARGDTTGDCSEAQLLRINRLCNEFEAGWKSGRQPAVESVLQGIAEEDRAAVIPELLALEIEYRRRHGMPTTLDYYAARFPDLGRERLVPLLESDEPRIPETLGDYRIVGRLGKGGMGTVYMAVHERMGRTVALKVLRLEKQRDPDWLKRFDREVRAAGRLIHPNIVAAYDAREAGGLHFLITEFVDGADLDVLVRRQGPLPVDLAVDCILQAARGLDYAHRQGVVHRDVKPSNLLRDGEGVVKVLDMGLARLETSDPTAADLTKSGVMMGSFGYMAPEQARDTRRADARADIYSLGCTLYFLLTGRPVFDSANAAATILSHVSQAPPSLTAAHAAVPPALDAVFRRMVAKDPRDRFQTAAELISALEALTIRPDDARATATEPPTSRVATSPPGRRWFLAVGGLGVLAVAAAIVIASRGGGDAGPSRDRELLDFDGRSSHVAVPDLVPTAGADYTLEAICRPRSFRTSNVMSWLGPDWMAVFLASDGRWGLARRFAGASSLRVAVERARLGEMVHLAGVFRGADLSLFINGRLVETERVEFPLADTRGGLFVGGVRRDLLPSDQNDRFFDGAIAAVRISRGARYHGAFSPPTALSHDTDTVAVFTFDAGRGSETLSSDNPPRTGRIVDAVWVRDAPAASR